MSPQPKRKHSSMRQGKRRRGIRLSLSNLVPCPSCGQQKLGHFACPKCGFYKNRQIFSPARKEKKE